MISETRPLGAGFGLGLLFKGGDTVLMIEKLIVVPVELPRSGDIFFAVRLEFLHDAIQLGDDCIELVVEFRVLPVSGNEIR